MAVDRPHFRFPFGLGEDGRVGVLEQDTPDHVMSCEHVIVRCPVGWRQERPEFGWAFPEFRATPLDVGPLEAALAQFEPRGNADAHEWADEADAAVRHITVNVEVSNG